MSTTDLRPLTYTDSLNFLLPLRSVGKEKGKGREREIIDLDESPRPQSEEAGRQQGADAPAASLIMAIREWEERNTRLGSGNEQRNEPGASCSESNNTADPVQGRGGSSKNADGGPT